MKQHFQTAMASLAILAAWPLWTALAHGADDAGKPVIPCPKALRDAEVTVSQMADGQSESLIIGNGGLYGIVWGKEGGMRLRITKNDIWDARVDTSKDGPLPKVNVRTRAMTGSGVPPSYGNAFPQPLCAAALRIGGTASAKGVSLVTSFDITTGDVRGAAIALAKKTVAEVGRSQEQLIAGHEKVWRDFWARSGVELGDRDLQHWWYRMMYLARTVSRPGGRFPVGLMPPLATDDTPWHADFHFNYNSWQPFWSVISPNHPELADPWISYVHELLPRAQWQAKEVFDCEGLFYNISQFLHEPDPAACKSVNKRSLMMDPFGMTFGMVGMTAQNLWHKHLCDPDRAYLEARIYPTLREAARFYLSFMKQCGKDANGKPVVVDWAGCKYKEVGEHNITVPASPVFPAEQVTWFSPEPVKELFRRTIKDTKHNGNNSHVMFNIAKARLSMPESAQFGELVSGTRRAEPGIKYYSGKATYRKTFDMPEALRQAQRLRLNVGVVKHVAEVRLNGRKLGVVWTHPFGVDITDAVKPVGNQLEIDVINLWPNRLMGDAAQPAGKRLTRTNVTMDPNRPLLESGLLGPVTVQESR